MKIDVDEKRKVRRSKKIILNIKTAQEIFIKNCIVFIKY